MTAIRMNGSDILRSTSRMMIKIAMIEIVLTTLKSVLVVSIISFIHGASPMSIPFSSYFLMISLSASICSPTLSLAEWYSELIKSSSYLSFSRTLLSLSGMISSGTVDPIRLSMPKTDLTPSTSFISPTIFLTSLELMEESISTIWVELML